MEEKFELRSPLTPYICSTPEDFQEEREWLAEHVFPELAQLCVARGTYFSPVDVRWTPSDSLTQEGELLHTLLDLIGASSPFFLCLLGERYGCGAQGVGEVNSDSGQEKNWVQGNLVKAAENGHQWVQHEDYLGSSFTELEISAAALRGDCHHCTFYFRQAEHLDLKLQRVSSEAAASRLKQLHQAENEHAALKQLSLKQVVVKRGLPVSYFTSCQELGASVTRDWRAILDAVCPPFLNDASFLDSARYQQWVAREALLSRLSSGFVSSEDSDSLREQLSLFALEVRHRNPSEAEEVGEVLHVMEESASNLFKHRKKKSEKKPVKKICLLSGERGTGKSSILAHWIKEFREENPHIFLIYHFIGASPGDDDIAAFLRTCTRELRKHFLLTEVYKDADSEERSRWWSEEDLETPDEFSALCQAFAAALGLGPCVLLLDGLHALSATLGLSQQEVKEFGWLPSILPSHCRLVMSTTRADLSHRSLKQRQDVLLKTVDNTRDPEEKRLLLLNTLKPHVTPYLQHTKTPVSEMRFLTTPLAIQVAATEINQPSVHKDMDQFLESHSKKAGISAFFQSCLQSWVLTHSWIPEEEDSQLTKDDATFDYSGWVMDALCLLAVSRGGLLMGEVLQLLQELGYTGPLTVTPLHWLRFRLHVGGLLWDSADGRIRFAYLEDTVEYILLCSYSSPDLASLSSSQGSARKRKMHLALCKFFDQQPLSWRQAQELPWHYTGAGDLNGLLTYITHDRVMQLLVARKELYPDAYHDLRLYWDMLKIHGEKPGFFYLCMLQEMGVRMAGDSQYDLVYRESALEPEECEVEKVINLTRAKKLDSDPSSKCLIPLPDRKVGSGDPRVNILSRLQSFVQDTSTPKKVRAEFDGSGESRLYKPSSYRLKGSSATPPAADAAQSRSLLSQSSRMSVDLHSRQTTPGVATRPTSVSGPTRRASVGVHTRRRSSFIYIPETKKRSTYKFDLSKELSTPGILRDQSVKKQNTKVIFALDTDKSSNAATSEENVSTNAVNAEENASLTVGNALTAAEKEEAVNRSSVEDPRPSSFFLTGPEGKLKNIPRLSETVVGREAEGLLMELSYAVGCFLQSVDQTDVALSIFRPLLLLLQSSPALSAGAHCLLVRVNQRLGTLAYLAHDLAQAQAHFAQALKDSRRLREKHGDVDPCLIDTLQGSLLASSGYVSVLLGKQEEGGGLLQQAMEAISELSGNHLVRANLHFYLGLYRNGRREPERAESSFRQCLALRQQWHGQFHPEVATAHHCLASVLHSLYRQRPQKELRQSAIEFYRKALAVSKQCLGNKHMQVAEISSGLAHLLEDDIDLCCRKESVGLLQQCLDIQTTHLGADHTETKTSRMRIRRSGMSLASQTSLTTTAPPRHRKLGVAERPATFQIPPPRSRSFTGIRYAGESDRANSLVNTSLPYSRLLSAASKMGLRDDVSRLKLQERGSLPDSGAATSAGQGQRKKMAMSVYVQHSRDLEVEENMSGWREMMEEEEDKAWEEGEEEEEVDQSWEPPVVEGIKKRPKSSPAVQNREPGSGGPSDERLWERHHRPNSSREHQMKGIKNHEDHCACPGPHDPVSVHGVSFTSGPNSQIQSLVPRVPSARDSTSSPTSHKSAFYHVPGRYPTSLHSFPPRRSQRTQRARDLDAILGPRLNLIRQHPSFFCRPRSAAAPKIRVNQADVTSLVRLAELNQPETLGSQILNSAREAGEFSPRKDSEEGRAYSAQFRLDEDGVYGTQVRLNEGRVYSARSRLTKGAGEGKAVEREGRSVSADPRRSYSAKAVYSARSSVKFGTPITVN